MKCGVRAVKYRRRPARTPRADDEILCIHGSNGLRVCATAQPSKLPINNGNLPRASTWNRKVSRKPSAIQKIHCYGRIPKKPDRHGGTTNLHVLTGGPVNRIWTGLSARYVTEYFYLLQGGRRNGPRGKHGKNDGDL